MSLLYRLMSLSSTLSPLMAFVLRRYALRVDVKPDLKSKLSEWCSAVGTGFICAFEKEGDNEHVHLIIDSHKDIKQLRNSFTKKFTECTGNKGYSLKVCGDDFSAYVRYICKGSSSREPPVIWFHQGLDYSAQAIREAHEKYWVNNASLQENSRKRARVEKESIVDQVEREAKAQGLKGMDRVEVAKIYIRLFRDARKGINVFAARAVVNTVCCCLDRGDYAEEALATKIADL